jgi:hypothetical protein
MLQAILWRIIYWVLGLIGKAALKGAAPKDFTPEQKDAVARGKEPNLAGQSARPFNRQKDE